MTVTNINASLPIYTDTDYRTNPLTEESASASSSSDFSALLQEAITNNMINNTIALLGNSNSDSGSGKSDSLLAGIYPGGDDLSSLLLQTALSGGEMSDKDISMYMMMLMMQEFSGSDIAPLLNVMGALLGDGMGTNSGLISGSGAASYVGSSDGRNYYSYSGIPNSAGIPTSVRSSSTPGNRSAAALSQAISALHVETSERYRPYRNGNTYCNIFVWDLTSAMNAELPHYVDSATGAPRSYPNTKGAYELDANGVHDWLARYGAQYGWREISAPEAQAAANKGQVAVTAWRSSDGSAGHVQVVCPSRNNAYDPARGVTVAQAGGKNYEYAYLNETFRSSRIPEVRYFVHE